MSVNLRPGIYSSYEVNIERINTEGKIVALCAEAGGDEIKRIASLADAIDVYGGECNMTNLIKLILNNGASEVKAIPVAEGDYVSAFRTAVQDKDVKYLVCDSEDASVHILLKTALDGADDDKKYKLGIVQMQGNYDELISAAGILNCERMVLCGNSETSGIPGSVAAAFAGMLASRNDPAMPLNGAVLGNISDLARSFSDAQVEQLLRGGVTPVELDAGEAIVVRGVTTKTKTDGVYDDTLRDANTMLVIDDVIPAVYASLKKYFTNSKNTVQTRGAIKTQVMLVLEEKVRQEIIADYDSVRAVADENDPSICRVSFSFSVMRGLNTIELLACLNL